MIGVDNDELLCRMCSPPLSSVIPNAEGVGYLAAESLARLMSGAAVSNRLQTVQPLRVAVRQSTDVVAIDDPHVAAALSLIRENACRGMTVDQVTKAADVSRSTLERQFRRLLGRTPQQEIRHVQIRRVKELLATTDLSSERIAALTGFEHPEYMHVVFKRLVKQTPGQFRRSVMG